MGVQIVTRTGHPSILELPWHLPLDDWRSRRIVEVARGRHRHVVRFLELEGAVYAFKETSPAAAEREYGLLRRLVSAGLPAVDPVGLVTVRTTPDGAPLDSVLITRHLEFSLPFLTLFGRPGIDDLRNRLFDAMAELLVTLHLEGFYWGDCSLSNTLFRRDAGALAAYLVDAETGEWHGSLSDGQRMHELDIAEENIFGELLQLAAEGLVASTLDPEEVALEARARYERLWAEVTREELFGPGERFRVDARLRRLNELGFDVEELQLIETEGGFRLRVHPSVVEPGRHRRRLMDLTGLHAQEKQARRLLNDLACFRAEVEKAEGRSLPESVVSYRWLNDVFEPTIAAIPPELSDKLEPAEAFHQVLEHRWFLSEAAGRDVGLEAAVRSYVNEVLRHSPDERRLLPPDPAFDDDD